MRNKENSDIISYKYKKIIPTGFLIGAVLLSGAAILFFIQITGVSNLLQGVGFSEEQIGKISAICVFGIWGWMGIIVIVRRELPQLFLIITGMRAVILGVFMSSFFWLIAGITLLSLFR